MRRHDDAKLVASKEKSVHLRAQEFEMKRVYTMKSLGIKPRPIDVAKLKENKYPNLHRRQVKNIPKVRPKMLIGQDYHHLLCN